MNKIQYIASVRKKTGLVFFVFCIWFANAHAQKMKNHLHKELIAKVGTIYEETPDDNPCAGSEIYLIFLFDKKRVQVVEKVISTCDQESIYTIGTYPWKLLDSKEIKIDFDPVMVEGTSAKGLFLELRNQQVIGNITHLNGKVVEYIFKEAKEL